MSIPRAHVVGSLLRPKYLRQAFQNQAENPDEKKHLKDLIQQAVKESIALQEESGIDVITDGEQGRLLFQDSLGAAVEGIGTVPGGKGGIVIEAAMSSETFQNEDDIETNTEERGYTCAAITEPLRRKQSVALQEYLFSSQIAQKPVKVTFPTPSLVTLTYWSPQSSTGVYPTASKAMRAWGEILKKEVQDLVKAGCRYIQMDAPELTFPIGAWNWVVERAGFSSTEEYISECAAVINDVAGSAPEVEFSLHICRGNDQGRWHTSGGYDAVKGLFNQLSNVRYLFLEYDSPRAGTFDVLSSIPDDKVVVLGLVSTKTDEVEDFDEVVARVHEAARFHPLEQLAISPQCGFASVVSGNPISFETQKAKLKLVHDVATHIWS